MEGFGERGELWLKVGLEDGDSSCKMKPPIWGSSEGRIDHGNDYKGAMILDFVMNMCKSLLDVGYFVMHVSDFSVLLLVNKWVNL